MGDGYTVKKTVTVVLVLVVVDPRAIEYTHGVCFGNGHCLVLAIMKSWCYYTRKAGKEKERRMRALSGR
jgi:hypothetical protein